MSRSLSHLALATILLASVSIGATGCEGKVDRPDGGDGLLNEGAMAPDLRSTAHDGQEIALRELRAVAVVYFYPKDNTPGCTAEACAFRDAWDRLEGAGVKVIGVSADDNESHVAFAEEHELPFPLIADPEGEWAKAFGVPTRAGYMKRVSFMLDASGKVAKVYPGVDPGIHADQVLTDAKSL